MSGKMEKKEVLVTWEGRSLSVATNGKKIRVESVIYDCDQRPFEKLHVDLTPEEASRFGAWLLELAPPPKKPRWKRPLRKP